MRWADPEPAGHEAPVLPDLLILVAIFAGIGSFAVCFIATARAVLGGRKGEKSSAGKVSGAVGGSLVGGLIAYVAVIAVGLCLYGLSRLLRTEFHNGVLENVWGFSAWPAVVGAMIACGIYGATSDKKKVTSGCLGAFIGCVAGALLGGAPAFLGGLLFETWCSHNMNPDAQMGIGLLTGGILLIALYGGALCGIIVGLVWGLRRVKRP
jgi:hypothetical protein